MMESVFIRAKVVSFFYSREIPKVKDRLRNHAIEEDTWEIESDMRAQYPYLFKSLDDFYDDVCPEALPTIKRAVEDAVRQERRMGASLLRLHFHDCFVNGCDASVLLDQTSTIDSGKTSHANNNSARGFEVIDRIKSKVDKICGRPVVSCADILAVAACDSLVAVMGVKRAGPHQPGTGPSILTELRAGF
ncbi:Cationic peroxidase 1 [Capsicum chinense]|nr:Cationic peroxidase 1 [Capsicum chinense]